jgi:hypothetical protein
MTKRPTQLFLLTASVISLAIGLGYSHRLTVNDSIAAAKSQTIIGAENAHQGETEPEAKVVNGEVWITSQKLAHKVHTASAQQGIDRLIWSPNHDFLAFEEFNAQGHSPMTTTHVWVAKADGTGCREVSLPSPLTAFSAYIVSWVSPSALTVRAEIPSLTGEITFQYTYGANSAQPVN